MIRAVYKDQRTTYKVLKFKKIGHGNMKIDTTKTIINFLKFMLRRPVFFTRFIV